jgi:hypothetical protein
MLRDTPHLTFCWFPAGKKRGAVLEKRMEHGEYVREVDLGGARDGGDWIPPMYGLTGEPPTEDSDARPW